MRKITAVATLGRTVTLTSDPLTNSPTHPRKGHRGGCGAPRGAGHVTATPAGPAQRQHAGVDRPRHRRTDRAVHGSAHHRGERRRRPIRAPGMAGGRLFVHLTHARTFQTRVSGSRCALLFRSTDERLECAACVRRRRRTRPPSRSPLTVPPPRRPRPPRAPRRALSESSRRRRGCRQRQTFTRRATNRVAIQSPKALLENPLEEPLESAIL